MRFFKAEPIARKEKNIILKRIAERLLAAKKDIAIDKLKDHVRYGILYQNEQGQWRIADNKDTARVPKGLYTFVQTEAGIIRLEPLHHGETKHLVLSDYCDQVHYAGWISFKKDGSGEMEYWNNDSGGYKPSPYQCQQARLPIDLFREEAVSLRGTEFSLDTHKHMLQQAAAYTFINAYRRYKALGQKLHVTEIKPQALSTEDELSAKTISVTCA